MRNETNKGEGADAEPGISKLRATLNEYFSGHSIALTGLFILAVIYTLYVARAIFIPISFALLFNLLLTPVVEFLRRLHVRREAGAALVLAAFLALLSTSVYFLYLPASNWVDKAPQTLNQIENKVRERIEHVETAGNSSKKDEKVNVAETNTESSTFEPEPDLFNIIIHRTWSFVFGFATMLILLYFFLASGDLFLRKAINVLPSLEDKKQAIEIARDIQSEISIYLYTIIMIYICVGVLVGSAMYLLDMPDPFLWGAMAGLLNFIPYLGPTVGITIVTVVASITFHDPYRIILPPLAYFAVIGLEGNFITPMIVGKRLLLYPVVIFLSLVFWGWLWGIAGALLAIPIVVTLKIVCDNVVSLGAIGEFLGK